MAKHCWKCQQKIKRFERKNRFKERENKAKVWLHNECYLKLSADEMKQLSYDISCGPPTGLVSQLSITGFAIGGLTGSATASIGEFSGYMFMVKRMLKKKGIGFEELDDYCIDTYGYHYSVLPQKIRDTVNERFKK